MADHLRGRRCLRMGQSPSQNQQQQQGGVGAGPGACGGFLPFNKLCKFIIARGNNYFFPETPVTPPLLLHFFRLDGREG